MRVLISGLAGTKLGGIETFLLNMNYYMSVNCIFDYVIEGANCIHKDAIEAKGGTIYYLPPRRPGVLKNILAWRALLKNKKSLPKVVYFNVFSLSYAFPIFLCKYYGYKVVVHAHASGFHNSGLLLKCLHDLTKQVLKLVNVKRLTNSKLSSVFMFGTPEAGEMIYNAIDVERFKFNAEIRHKLRYRYGLKDKIVFGFAGRLVYEKDPLFLLDIFNEILKINQSSMLMLVGDGDLMPEIKAKIRNYGIDQAVLLLGVCKNVEEFYQVMDVFILPSRFEGLGIALIEAQTAGLPCLTSAQVVPPEAKVTDLLSYVPLKNNPVEWAQKALQKLNSNSQGRSQVYEMIKDGHFNITRESSRLEKMLCEYGQG